MRAIYVQDYVKSLDSLRTIQVPAPQFNINSSRVQIRVRITHTSPTHVDSLYAQGRHQNNHAGLVHPPFILGTEFAGVVDDIHIPSTLKPFDHRLERLDQDLSLTGGLRKGDKVWGHAQGAFAPFIIVSKDALHRLPDGISLADAAALGATTAPVSYGALVRVGGLQKGETVLIHAAAGGLGVAAVRIAKAVGAKVIATVGSPEKKAVVEQMLREATVTTTNTTTTGTNRNTGDISCQADGDGEGVVLYSHDNWEKEVLSLSKGKGVDLVFDTVGLVTKSIRCCKFGGRIVIVGFVGLNGKMEQVSMNRILLRGVKVMGYRFGETGRRDPAENRKTWEDFESLLETGRVQPVIFRRYQGIGQIVPALLAMETRKVYGKILIETTQEDAGEHEGKAGEKPSHAKPKKSVL